MTWEDLALCKGKHSDIWFPPLEAADEPFYAVARVVCSACPVWEECRSAGVDEEHGMWGGLTPGERRAAHGGGSIRSLRHHGTWQRYRQGCSCEDCTEAHDSRYILRDTSKIPGSTEELHIQSLKLSILR